MMMMMMMMMIYYDDENTQMKLVNSGTKFRPRIDKFSQPNSGGPQFQKRARGYIYIHIYIYIYRSQTFVWILGNIINSTQRCTSVETPAPGGRPCQHPECHHGAIGRGGICRQDATGGWVSMDWLGYPAW